MQTFRDRLLHRGILVFILSQGGYILIYLVKVLLFHYSRQLSNFTYIDSILVKIIQI